jgi:hypothetical protein
MPKYEKLEEPNKGKIYDAIGSGGPGNYKDISTGQIGGIGWGGVGGKGYPLPHTGEMVTKSARDIVDRALAADEPVFVIRARDVCAMPALAAYLRQVQVGTSPPELVDSIEKIFKAFRSWQQENSRLVKFPD